MKKIISTFLILVLGLMITFPSFALGLSTEKDEVVYAVLDLDGSVQEVYVVNSFKGGTITDYGDYSEINNMSSSEELTQSGDTITIDTKADNFYYQGTLENKKLPWNIKIGYQLDEEVISASELAGKSGELTITLSTAPNTSVNSAFFENYMLQISLMLDTDKCTDIFSPNATLANAGKNKVITHTVMPEENANIKIIANVKDFSMGGFEITALPLSMSIEMPDTGELTEGMNSLSDAVNALNLGVKKLSDGIGETYSGTQELNVGSAEIAKGLSALNGNSAQVLTGSTQIHQALGTILKGLEGGNGDFSFDDIEKLPVNLRKLAEGLTGPENSIKVGLQGLKAGFSSLSTEILKIPDTDVDSTALYGAIEGNDVLKGNLDQLMLYYAAGKTVKGTYMGWNAQANIDESFNTMITSIDTISGGLTTMANEIETSLGKMDIIAQMKQLKNGLSKLSDNYYTFHKGLAAYTGGVANLSSGYGEINSGINALTVGIGELNAGSKELYKGTGKLNDAVRDLPDTIETEIDKMVEQYDKSDFVPISFVSDKNTKVTAVQFVIKTGVIEVPEVLEPTDKVPENLDFWQKLLKLFGL